MQSKFLFLLLFVCISGFAQNNITGKITSADKPVPFANIYVQGKTKGTTSNSEGTYALKDLPKGDVVLYISAIGYKTLSRTLELDSEDLILNVSLEEDPQQLSEIRIIDRHTGLTRRTPYTVSSLDMQEITSIGQPNGMMGSLRKIPGVYGAEFGQGIVKPFIRGLGFSRVVTVYQGNKLENHQWGADHGLGVNDLGIAGVDVIKGPASVLYGSGALGGVILVKDEEKHLESTDLSGNIGFTYNSVSNGLRGYTSLGKAFKKGWFLGVDAAYESHADYYNGEDQLIGNSRFGTQSLRIHSGIKKEFYENKLSFSYHKQDLGIISDDEMENPQTTYRNDRNMQLPFQEVTDYMLSFNQQTRHKGFNTSLHISHHFNDRKEIEADRNSVDMGLLQNNSFYNARINIPGRRFTHNIGFQGSYIVTRNLESALDFLIPDARVFENGLFYMGELDLNNWFLQGALRYDLRTTTADASGRHFIDYGFQLPGEPEDRKLSRTFKGFTGSFGASNTFSEGQQLSLNLSTGYRAPDLAELFSFGPHPGTSRFEQGNDQFDREQSFQADLGYQFRKDDLHFSLSVFGSLVDNYIIFLDTGERRDNGQQIWSYEQTAAGLYGLEFEMSRAWLSNNRLQTTLSGAMVRGQDRTQEKDLGFIPPDNLNLKMEYFALKNKSLRFLSSFRGIKQQDRVGRNELPTPGYWLLDLGASKEFDIHGNELVLGANIHNLLNKNYVDHMSILRAFEISSPGRNIMLNLKYAF